MSLMTAILAINLIYSTSSDTLNNHGSRPRCVILNNIVFLVLIRAEIVYTEFIYTRARSVPLITSAAFTIAARLNTRCPRSRWIKMK